MLSSYFIRPRLSIGSLLFAKKGRGAHIHARPLLSYMSVSRSMQVNSESMW